MKVTRKEWEVLKQALNEFAASQGIRMSKAKINKVKVDCNDSMAVAFNLGDRFKMELTFPKGMKP